MFKSLLQLTSSERKIIFLSALGGALEFYDFIIYVFFANVLSELFFPAKDHLASLMGIFAVFAVGYFTRPLGGLIFSHFGDKYGRKKTFIATLLLMALPTFFIGLLPTYATAGLFATMMLILLRMIQGLSVGGEIPGAITFAGEHVAATYRGMTCAIIFFGINMGMMLGSGVSALLTELSSKEQLLSWGWRIPFILGGLLGIISFYLRKQMSETPIFTSQFTQKPKVPIFRVLRHHLLQTVQGICLAWLGAVVISLLFLYMPVYLADILHYPKDLVSNLNTLNILLFSLLIIVMGWLSDIFGRKIILLIGSLGLAIFGYCLFFLLAQRQISYLIIVMLAFSLLSSCITGVYPCTISELFPTQIRYTGMAASYNIAFGIFGGLAPLIATYLIKTTNNSLSPSFYLIISAVACSCAIIRLKNRNKVSLTTIE